MSVLQCELCGGKLIGKPDSVFECDHCGMEYSSEWAKAKIQKIKGTVRVEGTVQVAGTVKVEGGVNIESLLKRGQMALEDKEWEKADKFFDDALNLNAECSDAYLGKYYAQIHAVNNADILDGISTEQQAKNVLENQNFQKAVRFSSSQIANDLYKKLNKIICEDKQRRENFKAIHPVNRQRITDNLQLVCGGDRHTVALQTDGTVVDVGSNEYGQCDVGSWCDIVAVSAGGCHTVGLRTDGTVVAVGDNVYGQCNVDNWRNIVAVSAGGNHIVGLRSDGTVAAAGFKQNGRCDVDKWRDIVAVSAGGCHTVGLRTDGTVVAVGDNVYGQCNVESWHNIAIIHAGWFHTIGLRPDGTVVAVGYNKERQCDVFNWCDVISIFAGYNHTLGMWSDGTVAAVGSNTYGQCNVDSWILFNSVDVIGKDTTKSKEKRAADLNIEKASLNSEYLNLKGLFTGKRKKIIEARLKEIDIELSSLK